MKMFVTTLGVIALLAIAASTSFASNAVRISEVYGGGGSAAGSGATYNQDYVQLYNDSGAPVNIGNWTIEYGSATGNWGSSAGNIFTFPANVLIQPCGYILVAFGTPSAGGSALPLPPDFVGTLSMSATSGKVALFNAVNTNLACGSELAGTLVDKVAYGTGNCPEGTAVGVLSVTTAAVRGSGGKTDTDNNLADLSVVASPFPLNSTVFNPLCQCTITNVSYNSPLCPGDVVTIFGSGFSAYANVNMGNSPPGIPCPMTFVSSTEINFTVPAALSGYSGLTIVVSGPSNCSIGPPVPWISVSDSATCLPTGSRHRTWGEVKSIYR